MQFTKKLILSITALCFLFAPLQVMADFFPYKLEGLPVVTEDCMVEAEGWGQKLRESAGVQIFSVDCSPGDVLGRGGQDITITYESTSPLPKGTSLHESPYRRAYQSEGECLDDLDHQQSLFTQMTGLEVFAAYCSPNGYLYVRSIDDSPVKRHTFNAFFGGISDWGSLIEDAQAEARRIKDAVGALGVVVASVGIANGGAVINYYSEKRLNLQFVHETSYVSDEDCSGTMTTISDWISLWDGRAVYQLCASNSNYPVPMKALYNLVAMPYPFFFPQIGQLYRNTVPGKYDSLEECQTDKNRIANIYSDRFGFSVYSTLCTLDGEEIRRYNMYLYGRKK